MSELYFGRVLGAELATPVADACVRVLDENDRVLVSTVSDQFGRWSISDGALFTTMPRYLSVSAPGYCDKHLKIDESHAVIRLLEDKLIGYQDKLWFVPGEKVTVYVHSTTQYSALLFRHGLEKKCCKDFGLKPSHIQSVPDSFFVEKGLTWAPSFSFTLPRSAEPGIYSVLLTSIHSNYDQFAIPFIVSTPKHDRGKNSRILVLASTNTWQSYNTWGGRSRYRNYETNTSDDFIASKKASLVVLGKRFVAGILPIKLKTVLKRILRMQSDTEHWMLDWLSIKRPLVNCALEQESVYLPFTNHLAAGEWRVLAWLEREGIRYDMISGYEFDLDPECLASYNAVLLSTHSEYWSKKMYMSLQSRFLNNGLWILNISGNSIYREVAFFSDGSLRCISLSFAKSVGDETELLAVRFSTSDYSKCTNFKVLESNHWAFYGAPLNQDSPYFGGLSLNQNTTTETSRYDPGRPGTRFGLIGQGASGWECDQLSKTAPKDVTVIAKGNNEKGGADMVIREPEGTRGGLFSVSSITFGGSLLIDAVASKLVSNVIQRAISDSK